MGAQDEERRTAAAVGLAAQPDERRTAARAVLFRSARAKGPGDPAPVPLGPLNSVRPKSGIKPALGFGAAVALRAVLTPRCASAPYRYPLPRRGHPGPPWEGQICNNQLVTASTLAPEFRAHQVTRPPSISQIGMVKWVKTAEGSAAKKKFTAIKVITVSTFVWKTTDTSKALVHP